MKTITEYQPMIFSQLAALAEKRSSRRQQMRAELLWVGGYSGFGLWLSFDTGFLIWDWQFWVIFAPLLVAVEMASRMIRKNFKTLGV